MNKTQQMLCTLIALLSITLSALAEPSPCAHCHKEETQLWLQSHHYRSMQVANAETVLGDFSGVALTEGERSSRFIKQGQQFFIETGNAGETLQRYPVKYTFGYSPLQQYLLETEAGRLQAYDIAWDSRPENQGGQRWFALQDKAANNPQHPFFWRGYYHNWNSRCASCHSTALEKNYRPSTQSFATQFSAVNVGCESCHGDGKLHRERAENNTLAKLGSGLKTLSPPTAFAFTEHSAIAVAAKPGVNQGQVMDTCGGCHSRRGELSANTSEASYHDQFQLEDLQPPLYHSDGSINEEVFVLGSFLQSKMAQQGVTCTHCHNPHSGKLHQPGADVCTNCHRASVFKAAKHLNGHTTANCLDCHMPTTTYMKIDARRDHRFVRPNPQVSQSHYPCRACHSEARHTDAWFQSALEKWPPRKQASADSAAQWAQLNMATGLQQDTYSYIADLSNPPILSATLLSKLATQGAELPAELLKQSATSKDPLLRKTVADALQRATPHVANKLIHQLINDKTKVVRMAAARAIILNNAFSTTFNNAANNTASGSPQGSSTAYQKVLKEYEQSLQSGQDHPGPNIGLAQLARYRGELKKAEAYYNQALSITPNNLEALLSLAEFKRQLGDNAAEGALLQQALKHSEPSHADNPTVHFAYGLYLIRQQQLQSALPHLEQAYAHPDGVAYYAYVYAVALWQSGQQNATFKVIKLANTRWPAQQNLLTLWLSYAYQAGEAQQFLQARSELAAHYPDAPLLSQLPLSLSAP